MNNFNPEDEKDAEEIPTAPEKESKKKEDPETDDQSYEDPDAAFQESGEGEEEKPRTKGQEIRARLLRGFTGLVVACTAISIYWNLIPESFDVKVTARERAERYGHREPGEPLPRGYLSTAATIEVAELLLDKPGGYMSNDWNPMSRIPDNMRNWEYGMVVQLRVLVQGLRFELSRAGPQSAEHPQLRQAETFFNFRHDSLVLPSTESQYRQGIRHLKDYLEALNNSTDEGKYFASRQDQIIRWLERQQIMLGDYASRLQGNVGAVTYDQGLLTYNLSALNMSPEELAEMEMPMRNPSQEVNSIFDRDDVFYQARGGIYALYHVTLALRSDIEKVLNDSQSMGIMNRVINELESANQPMRSPMVLNGREFGFVQNHSLILAAHVARAHLAMQELQRQISGGGRGN